MFANRIVKFCEDKQNHLIDLAKGMEEWVAVIVSLSIVKHND